MILNTFIDVLIIIMQHIDMFIRNSRIEAMLASDLMNKDNELHYKVRTVSDLIRHVQTRESESKTPNYNLFFGAGCSVSSEIKPAGVLIDIWLKELYERFNSCLPESNDIAKEYFEKNHSNWYNRENPYSSLFEKMYEFASQRRRFVEKEVDSKLPAIGYAYLTSLVGDRYFNNIFTTNFDDLINEAFYQFSNDRPILCAHDSSIRSISITSKRPKVIKLHGDYLFDDIKSTLRETESLEQNTKEKLIEFCKDFGLIVVGYAGNDRSIMDVLDFLTKQENYLNNGVYWCLRPGDTINPTLRKLIWKEKVYPVIIDGFDELFAEMHRRIKNEGLDFEANITNSKINQIKNKILESSGSFKSNEFILKDIEGIKKSNDTQELSGLFNKLKDSENSGNFSLSDFKSFLEIEELLKREEYQKAYVLTEEKYYDIKEGDDKTRYISMLISISSDMNNTQSCLKWCDKLLEVDPHNNFYIIKKSSCIDDVSNKYKYMDDKVSAYPERYSLQNEAASAGLKLLKNNPSTTEVSNSILLKYLDKSLKLNPSLSNPAWKDKLEVLNRLKSEEVDKSDLSDKKSIKEIDDKIDDLLVKSEGINRKSIEFLDLKISKLIKSESFEELKSVIQTLYEIYKTSSKSHRDVVNSSLDDIFQSFPKFDKEYDHKELSSYFYETHLTDASIKDNSELLISKCSYFISTKRQVEKAKSYLISALDCGDIMKSMTQAIGLSNGLDRFCNDKLIEVLKKYRSSIYEMYYYEYMHELTDPLDNLPKCLEYLEKSYSLGLPATRYYCQISYVFILTENYQRLVDFEKLHENDLKSVKEEAFKINYLYALKMLNSPDFNNVHLLNVSSGSNEASFRLAAFAVLGNNNDVRRILSDEIKISYMRFYDYKKWPIIPKELIMQFEISDKNNEKVA